MNAEQVRAYMAENFYTFIILQVVIGLIFGSIPLIIGIRRGKRNLGLAGFILSGVIGALSPLISAVVAAVFTILVLRKPGGPETPQKPAD